MTLTAELLAGWQIETDRTTLPMAHAADELRSHLGRFSAAGGEGVLRLAARDAASDGFRVAARDGELLIEGDSERGALNGVYSVLGQLGFGWAEPGAAGFTSGGVLPAGEWGEQPTVRRRTLILGQDALHDDWRAWMEWASRNRLNDIFFHDTPPSRPGRESARPIDAEGMAADGGGWMFERWDADGPEIVAEARKRGMTLQFGGHHLPTLLPRELFAEHPEWFPLRKGRRDSRYNLCPTSGGATEYLRRAATVFFERFPGADVYHVWADDIRGGGWCACDSCEQLTPSDQALLATNVVAEALAEVAPGARIAHLAYHDTVAAPSAAQPADNVLGLWAPRGRCFAHGIDDAGCEKNRREFWDPFLGLVEVFGNDPGRVAVFEYWSDAILFKGIGPTHLRVGREDIRAYGAVAGNVQNLMVGDRPWVGAPWHAWWLAKLMWDSELEPEAALRQFCDAAYGENGDLMRSYYRKTEDGCLAFLDLHDLQPTPRHDVYDFSDEPRETLRQKARELATAAESFGEAARLLDELRDDAALERERAQARFVALAGEHFAARVAAWNALLDGDFEAAGPYLERADAALRGIGDWDRRWNTAGYGNIRVRLRQAMRRQVDSLAAQVESSREK